MDGKPKEITAVLHAVLEESTTGRFPQGAAGVC